MPRVHIACIICVGGIEYLEIHSEYRKYSINSLALLPFITPKKQHFGYFLVQTALANVSSICGMLLENKDGLQFLLAQKYTHGRLNLVMNQWILSPAQRQSLLRWEMYRDNASVSGSPLLHRDLRVLP
jgi:hypothetical protein